MGIGARALESVGEIIEETWPNRVKTLFAILLPNSAFRSNSTIY